MIGAAGYPMTGQTFAEMLRQIILEPLGLANTYFVPYEETPMQRVAGFDRDFASFPGLLKITPSNRSWATSAYASDALASTAEDLGTVTASLFSEDLVGVGSLRKMEAFGQAPNPDLPAQEGYGLGVMQMIHDGETLWGHVGWFMGGTAIAAYSAGEGYMIAVATNVSRPDLARVVAAIQHELP